MNKSRDQLTGQNAKEFAMAAKANGKNKHHVYCTGRNPKVQRKTGLILKDFSCT